MDTKATIENFLKIILPAILVVFIIFILVMPRVRENREINNQPNVTNFEECVAVGNPVMESYPRQCRHGDQIFMEEIGQIVGGDQDEHGCIGSAGYSWSEEREQCVRVWEVPIMVEAEQAVKEQLAEKYSKPLDSIVVKATKIDENHVAGSISFAPGTGVAGGAFLVFKENGVWQLVYDGNGSIDCDAMRQDYGFSDLVLAPQFCD